jgi:hypothetical protein
MKADAQKVFEVLGAEAGVVGYLWDVVDPSGTGGVTREQFAAGLWLIYMGRRVTLRVSATRQEVPIRWINCWTTCDACSRMLIPGYSTFGCQVCKHNGKSHHNVCQTCLKAGRVCRHVFRMEENVLKHRDGEPGVLARPRVLEDEETKVYFECQQCHGLLPAGSTVGLCGEHARNRVYNRN